MIRRRLTLKRVDPWSVLKFGFVVNIALLLVAMLGFWILWIVIGRLGLVEQFCDSVGSIVLDLQECSLNGGNIFRTLLLLGLLGVVVQTGIMVFGAFLYNLISDLTGGLGFTFLDESGDATMTTARKAAEATSGSGAGRETPGSRAGVGAGSSSGGDSAPRSDGGPPNTPGTTSPSGPPDQSSAPRRPTPDGPPPAPGQRQSTSPSAGTSGSSEPSTDSGRSHPGQSGSPSGSSLWGDPTRSSDRA